MNGLSDLTHYDSKPKQENYFDSLNDSACYCLDLLSYIFHEKEEGDVLIC